MAVTLTTQIRNAFSQAYVDVENDVVPDSDVLEIVGASFLADSPTLFGTINHSYVERELEWYESMSLYVDDIEGETPQIWKDVSSDSGRINSNYGYLLYSTGNGRQYENVVKTLRESPKGRRAVAIYTRPEMHAEWNTNGMTDFVCTNAVHYELRDGKLHVVVQMRSNDAVFGYKNDFAWQQLIQKKICAELEVDPGDIIWQAASLHVYPRHFYLVHHYSKTGEPTITKKQFCAYYPELTWMTHVK